ncbi:MULTISPECIES: hypothetical protein [Paenibacillus]|uniref:hypothetical protein n=1 Tax=Paenibacillus TaxID=44249 RepID=UPI001CC4EBA8|nr:MULTISPECIES: hypothetical protein [Paenibacillus]
MAYTRGNLAVQPQRKPESNPRYREKTKVVTRRTPLPLQEKLRYLLTLALFVLVAGVLVWRYVHIYDLNKQAQTLDGEIAQTKRQIAVYQMQKQELEQQVVDKAKAQGYRMPDSETYISVEPKPVSTKGGN